MFHRIFLCILFFSSGYTFSQEPLNHVITVLPDGSFSPQYMYVSEGDTVQWNFYSRQDNIIPVDSVSDAEAGITFSYKPYNPNDPNEFTGPMPEAVSGVFTQSPESPPTGFNINTMGDPCTGNVGAVAGNQFLCDDGVPFATMDWTWKNPNITGVNIRMRWNEIHLGPGLFDWSVMDREIKKAVENGKMYNLTFKAGGQGIPDWIFNPAVAGEHVVNPVTIQLVKETGTSCYVPWTFGSPADSNYLHHYFEMWEAAAEHLKGNNAWYRALAYIKPSGLNEISPENKLPRGCDEICNIVPCNDKVWAEEGHYTPEAVYAFYRKQTKLLAEIFPGKYMSYMLIQAGFPLINNYSEYQEPLTEPLPDGLDQTLTILENGRNEHGLLFVVQHNGVGPRPQDRNPPMDPCPNEGVHPAVRPFAFAGSGCPNRFVLFEGEAGQITGFQTNNESGVSNPVELESAFRNLWDNSDGIFFEIYEQRFWEAEERGPVLDPDATGRTIGEWDELLHQRRREFWPQLPDPFPMTYRHVFRSTGENPDSPQVFHYVNGSKSSTDSTNNNYGAVVVMPSGINSTEYNNGLDQSKKVRCYPNPFSESASITYTVEKEGMVHMGIYNALGQLVKTLVHQNQFPGKYTVTWKGKDDAGSTTEPGTYLLKVTLSDRRSVQKVMKVY